MNVHRLVLSAAAVFSVPASVVTSADTLTADIADNGGHAVRLVPSTP